MDEQESSALKIQALIRGRAVRNAMAQRQAAAVMIQALHRGRITRRELNNHHHHQNQIEEWHSSDDEDNSDARSDTASYMGTPRMNILERKSNLLQKKVNSMPVRGEIAKRQSAAVLIQSLHRGRIVRRRSSALLLHNGSAMEDWDDDMSSDSDDSDDDFDEEQVEYLTDEEFALLQESAATRIQSQYRGWSQRRQFNQEKQENDAARHIQRHYRGHKTRQSVQRQRDDRENAAATRIQSHVRRKQAEKQVQGKRQERDAAIRIQSVQRGRTDRRKANALREKKRQRQEREAARRQEEQLRKQQEAAAIHIQRVQKGRMARNKVAKIKLDMEIRQEQELAAVRIQAVHRGRRVRQERQQQDLAARKIQAVHRGRIGRAQAQQIKQEQQMQQEEEQAALRIQSLFRGHQARREVDDMRLMHQYTQDRLRAEPVGEKLSPQQQREQANRLSAPIRNRGPPPTPLVPIPNSKGKRYRKKWKETPANSLGIPEYDALKDPFISPTRRALLASALLTHIDHRKSMTPAMAHLEITAETLVEEQIEVQHRRKEAEKKKAKSPNSNSSKSPKSPYSSSSSTLSPRSRSTGKRKKKHRKSKKQKGKSKQNSDRPIIEAEPRYVKSRPGQLFLHDMYIDVEEKTKKVKVKMANGEQQVIQRKLVVFKSPKLRKNAYGNGNSPPRSQTALGVHTQHSQSSNRSGHGTSRLGSSWGQQSSSRSPFAIARTGIQVCVFDNSDKRFSRRDYITGERRRPWFTLTAKPNGDHRAFKTFYNSIMRKAGLMKSDAENQEYILFAPLDKLEINAMSQLYDGIELVLIHGVNGDIDSFKFGWFITKSEQKLGTRTCSECMASFSKQYPRLDSAENSGCAFHPGKIRDDVYTCCSQEVGSSPCTRGHHGAFVSPFVEDQDPEKEQELEDSYIVQLRKHEKNHLDEYEYAEDDDFDDDEEQQDLDEEPKTPGEIPNRHDRNSNSYFVTPSPYDRPRTTGTLFEDNEMSNEGWEQLHSTENSEFSQVLKVSPDSQSSQTSTAKKKHRHHHNKHRNRKRKHHHKKHRESDSPRKKTVTLHVFVHNEQTRKNKRTGRRNNARVQLSINVNDENLTMWSIVRSCLRKFIPHRFEEEAKTGEWFLFDPLSEMVMNEPSELRKGVDLVLMQGTPEQFKLSTFLIEKEVESALRECQHCGETFSLNSPNQESAVENNCYHHSEKANALGRYPCCGSYDDWGCKREHFGRILRPVRFADEEED